MLPALVGLQSVSWPARIAIPTVRAKSPPPVEQPEQDVGAVQPRVDVELVLDVAGVALARGVVRVPRRSSRLQVFRHEPGLAPVPAERVLDHLPVGAALRHGQPPGLDDLAEAAGAERLGGHRRHHHPAVDAVAVVHDVAGPPGDVDRGARLRGRHQPGEVGLDLEVDVVGEGVVVGIARGGRRDAGAAGSAGRAGWPRRGGSGWPRAAAPHSGQLASGSRASASRKGIST